MAAKLVIIKQVRPSLDVPFYSTSQETKQAIKATGIAATVGERNFRRGFKKVRTLFFPTVELYEAWASNATVAESIAARQAYNKANGIVERKTVVDLPNYKL